MKNKLKAFTLIELLVVIVIIGILATISTATFSGSIEKARLVKAQAAAANVKRQFISENITTEEDIFSGWYDFDEVGDVNPSNPYVIDKSEAKNDLTASLNSGPFSQSSETGSGIGNSLRINNRILYRGGTISGGPTDKITMAMWFKVNTIPDSYTYPFFLTSSTGFRVDADKSIRFYMNGSANIRIQSAPGLIDEGEWHYVVGSYNGDTDTMSLWVDGDLIGSSSIVQTAPFQGRGIYLGYRGGDYFDGWLDEVMLFPFAFDGEGLE